ncbi:sensor histidine kinase [Paenibacillus crassostreae]|uniref:histidine kinase n=1 Tax=Paenibacillus crassostreae TaxID=1763538 RepID=A0A167DTL4_9BACL|nr:HAMP domain-containing sensor histidine kinase [Paenibacillus crassostreae]AOZ91080.1 two-component sensor histidine kinase [Paenibacillus crassostreae]OAB74759.1 histidine kinase [Paenibacillus crassostreae]
MSKKGIRRQIVLHYFIVVFTALLLVEVIFLLAIRSYYYDSVYSYISSYVKNAEDFYQKFRFFEEEKINLLSDMLVNFKMNTTELQILDINGNVLINTTEFNPDTTITTSDIPQAISGDFGRWVGRQPSTDEDVMAVSKLLQMNGEEPYILRYTTSLTTVNDKLFDVTMLSTGIGVAVLAIVLAFSLGLANSIVKPLNNITAVSALMAKGKYKVRVKGDYRYELGELASTLNHMAEEIVRSNQIKDDFISSISHELRTPLTSIKGWSETLDSGGYDPEETKVGMQIISKETERLIGLVEEILDFSKLQQNEMRLVFGEVVLKELLQEIMLNMWTKAEKKNIKLVLESDENPIVIGDGNRLKQIFLNLVDNAIKFSDEGSVIQLVLNCYPGQVEVDVHDTGLGISEEHLNRVRDRFFQVNPLNGGTGLGLAISQQLVEQHHGTMEIVSELGKGTIVRVMLPLAEIKEDTDQPEDSVPI